MTTVPVTGIGHDPLEEPVTLAEGAVVVRYQCRDQGLPCERLETG